MYANVFGVERNLAAQSETRGGILDERRLDDGHFLSLSLFLERSNNLTKVHTVYDFGIRTFGNGPKRNKLRVFGIG